MRELNATQLSDYLATTESAPLLLDVREDWEFQKCHIDGSVLIPMRQIQSRLSELDPERETVVICHHGIRSRAVGHFLDSMGFENVINLSDGVDGWAKTVDKTMAVY
jgi:rhodanese-related sulfurtransferase